MSIRHVSGCTPNYPEKPTGEKPQAIIEIELEDPKEIVHQCSDCGAYEIVRKEQVFTTPELEAMWENNLDEDTMIKYLFTALRAREKQIGECTGGYETMEKELKALDSEIKRLKEEHIHDQAALAILRGALVASVEGKR